MACFSITEFSLKYACISDKILAKSLILKSRMKDKLELQNKKTPKTNDVVVDPENNCFHASKKSLGVVSTIGTVRFYTQL